MVRGDAEEKGGGGGPENGGARLPTRILLFTVKG